MLLCSQLRHQLESCQLSSQLESKEPRAIKKRNENNFAASHMQNTIKTVQSIYFLNAFQKSMSTKNN